MRVLFYSLHPNTVILFQVSVEELSPLECVPQVKSDRLVSDHPMSPLSPLQQEAHTPESQDSCRETAEEAEGESDSSGLQVEETSVLTNGELSEEEELVLSGSQSILPSSVLDQASVIAERFIGSLSRRSSLVSEELGPITSPSPSVDNDVFPSPSACMDLETQMLDRSSKELQVASENLSTPATEPAERALLEGEHRSTLSKQDRLLIHKIRRYYEHAEHQDANFSIKRRESLSYIPAGLVRHLSRQLNSGPQAHPVPVHRKGLSRHRPTSWSVFDLPGLNKSQNADSCLKAEPQRSPFEVKSRSQSITESSTTEEEFRLSIDMFKGHQDKETVEENQDVEQIAEENHDDSTIEAIQAVGSDSSDTKSSNEVPPVLTESKQSTASDGSSISLPATASPTAEGESSQGSRTPLTQGKNHFNRSHLPKIINFRTSTDEDQILEDMGKMRNKVFQLARQYSQRIKNNRPMVWQRNRETANQQGLRNMPAVPEEKRGKSDSNGAVSLLIEISLNLF